MAWVLALVAVLGFAAVLRLPGLRSKSDLRTSSEEAAPEAGYEPVEDSVESPGVVDRGADEVAAAPSVPPAAGSSAPRVALVIDDLGRSVATIDRLLGIGVPLSYSVLPFESRTPEVVARVRDAGAELLCHVPMEAQSGLDPGPGALMRTMSGQEIRRATSRALGEVPGAVGANNHMGSAFSEDAAAMSSFLEVVAEGGLFFLDSRTTAGTLGYLTARELGIPAAQRKVFLDRDRSPEAIRHEMTRVLEAAARGEVAIAIGHPYEETLAILEEEVPRAVAAGYRFVEVSELLAPAP